MKILCHSLRTAEYLIYELIECCLFQSKANGLVICIPLFALIVQQLKSNIYSFRNTSSLKYSIDPICPMLSDAGLTHHNFNTEADDM